MPGSEVLEFVHNGSHFLFLIFLIAIVNPSMPITNPIKITTEIAAKNRLSNLLCEASRLRQSHRGTVTGSR